MLYRHLDRVWFMFFVLGKFDYHCSFGNNQFSLSLNSNIIDTGSFSIYDSLYLLDTIASYNETLHVDSRGTKRKLNKKIQ